VKEVTKFIYEEGLNNLVVKQDSFRESWCALHVLRPHNRELILECVGHLTVLVLEGAHDVFTSNGEVHDACD
jgi:hypothetical protein